MFLLSFDSDEDKVFEALDISDDVHQALKDNIARRLTPKAVKIRSDIEVKCFSYEGIDAIKAALRAGEAVSTTSVPIKIRLVAPPLYVVSSNSTDKVGGVDLMEKALVEIERVISAAGGEMSVKMKVSREPCCALLLSCPVTDSRSPSFSPALYSQKPFPSRRTRSWLPSWPRSSGRTQRCRATRTEATTTSKKTTKKCQTPPSPCARPYFARMHESHLICASLSAQSIERKLVGQGGLCACDAQTRAPFAPSIACCSPPTSPSFLPSQVVFFCRGRSVAVHDPGPSLRSSRKLK